MIRSLKAVRWFSLLFGSAMYVFTEDAFGRVPAAFLGIFFGLWYWVICQNEKGREIRLGIAREIQRAIEEYGHIDNMVEIRRIRYGLVARIYLIDSKGKKECVQLAIRKHLEASSLKKYVWAMQLMDISSQYEFRAAEKSMDQELLEAVKKQRNRENRRN